MLTVEGSLDAIRYGVAAVVLVLLPPDLLLWFLIHPFARFWRRLGTVPSYGLLSIPVAAVLVSLFLARDRLLALEYGSDYRLIALGIAAWFASLRIARERARQLTFRILAGLPELSARRYPGKLLCEGIYARIRHPRYVETVFWILGCALFANYLALYVVLLLSIPTFYAIVLLEERELCRRFGDAYEEYRRRVPRFVPRFRGPA